MNNVFCNVLNVQIVLLTRYVACDNFTIADIAILASVTQLEAMDYRITAYKSVII